MRRPILASLCSRLNLNPFLILPILLLSRREDKGLLSSKREKFWYRLSEKLGIEIAIYGVGDWVHFPAQTSNSGGSFTTDDGEMAPWMMRAIDQRETPWWFHTHPDMPAFFSRGNGEHNDLRGAHDLWDMIRKPFKTIIRGHKNQRVEMTIDARWIRKNPPPAPWVPPPLPVLTAYHPSYLALPGYGHPQYPSAPAWKYNGPGDGLPPYAVPPGLDNEVSYLVQKYGAKSVYEALDQLVYTTYTDRDPKNLQGLAPW